MPDNNSDANGLHLVGTDQTWLELDQPRQWSRLLYTNPVCFLVVSDSNNHYPCHQNIMVVTWLTATNNDGHFLMSLHRRRHTVTELLKKWNEQKQQHNQAAANDGDGCTTNNISADLHPMRQGTTNVKFSLCVPVQGMEELVRRVGGTSGRWGSKFPADYPDHCHSDGGIVVEDERVPNEAVTKHDGDHVAHKRATQRTILKITPGSKRHRRRQHNSTFPCGIPGLSTASILLQNDSIPTATTTTTIRGTVAHLECVASCFLDNLIDDDHYLVLAHVTKAYVQVSYWNTRLNLFQPQNSQIPPYLTFFGSQMFGYVVANHEPIMNDSSIFGASNTEKISLTASASPRKDHSVKPSIADGKQEDKHGTDMKEG